jgi:hypothetical protein
MATQADTTSTSGGLKSLVFAVVGSCAIGLAAGYFAAGALILGASESLLTPENSAEQGPEGGEGSGQHEAPEAGAAGHAAADVPLGAFEIVPLPPIIANLDEPARVWVRLEGSLLFDPEGNANAQALAGKLAQHIMAYLKTLKLNDIQGAGAVQAVSRDIDEIVTTLSEGKVQGVLLSGLVFE